MPCELSLIGSQLFLHELFNWRLLGRCIKGRPAAARVILGVRTEEKNATDYAFILSFVSGFVIFVLEGRLGAILLSYLILHGCESFFELFFGERWFHALAEEIFNNPHGG